MPASGVKDHAERLAAVEWLDLPRVQNHPWTSSSRALETLEMATTLEVLHQTMIVLSKVTLRLLVAVVSHRHRPSSRPHPSPAHLDAGYRSIELVALYRQYIGFCYSSSRTRVFGTRLRIFRCFVSSSSRLFRVCHGSNDNQKV